MGVAPHAAGGPDGNDGRMEFPSLDLIRVFEYDPELLDGVDATAAAHLRARLAVRRSWADPQLSAFSERTKTDP